MGARGTFLITIASLAIAPAASQAAASIRVLDALGGRPITVMVSGQRTPLLTDTFGRVSQRYALQPGIRALTVKQHGRVITTLRLRLIDGEHVTLVLVVTATGPRLRPVVEPSPNAKNGLFLVVDATTTGPVSVTLGSSDLPTPLTLASGMKPGQWTRPVRVPTSSPVTAWYVSATVAGRSAGRQQLFPAAGSVTVFAVGQTRHGYTLLRLPWDVPTGYAVVSVTDTTHPGALTTGDTLRCATPTLYPAGSQRSFAWFADHTPLTVGASGPSYTIQGATGGGVGTTLNGASITCTVTVTPPNGAPTAFSASTPAVQDAAVAVITEADDQSNPSNIILTCSLPHGWSNAQATTFRWQKDGSFVGSGALTVPPSAVSFDANHPARYAYTCTATATGNGWIDSTPQQTANLPMLPSVSPSMMPEPPVVNVPETGSNPAWPDASASLTEEWFHACTSPGDASQGCVDTTSGGAVGSSTYSPVLADSTTYLGYRVKATDGAFYTYDFVFSLVVA